MTSATLDLIPVPSYDDLLGWVQRALPFSSTRIARMVYLFHAMPQLAAAELHGVFQPDTNLQPHLTIRRNTTGYLDVITHGTTFDCAIRDRMATGLFHVPGRGNVLFGLGAELALHVANAQRLQHLGLSLCWDAGCWTLTRGDAVILSGASQSEAAAAEAACLDLEEMGHVLNN